jgi:hypothetical protein
MTYIYIYISLYLNVCYGEQIEMHRWVSNSIIPLCLFLLFFYIILYFASDLLAKFLIKVVNIFIIIVLIIFLAIGCYAIALASSQKLTDIQPSWNLLSKQSKIYYYNNDINVLLNTFHTKMIVTGALFLFLFLIGVLILIFSYQYYYILAQTLYQWRPPLRSRLNDSRAKSMIDFYTKNDSEYKRLLNEANMGENNKLNNGNMVGKIDRIIDDEPSLPVVPKIKNESMNNPIINKLNEYNQVDTREKEDVNKYREIDRNIDTHNLPSRQQNKFPLKDTIENNNNNLGNIQSTPNKIDDNKINNTVSPSPVIQSPDVDNNRSKSKKILRRRRRDDDDNDQVNI